MYQNNREAFSPFPFVILFICANQRRKTSSFLYKESNLNYFCEFSFSIKRVNLKDFIFIDIPICSTKPCRNSIRYQTVAQDR